MDKQREISFLRKQLGVKLVAYIGSVTNSKIVTDWVEGRETPSSDAAERLAEAYEITLRLSSREGPKTIQAWMTGTEDPSIPAPARILREGSRAEREELIATAYIP
jgi:hypothetical protein